MNASGFANAIAPRLPFLTSDAYRRDTRYEQSKFAAIRRAELFYARQLRKIARHIGEIIRSFAPGDPQVLPQLEYTLNGYAGIIGPWARATAERMLTEVSRRDEMAWAEIAKKMVRPLREEIRSAPTGSLLKQILDEQVYLITSLPIQAGRRVHELTLEGLTTSERFKQIVPMILESGNVTVARANLIARTETAKTASALTQARAEHVGSEGYVWRTAKDFRVRPDHRVLEGTFHKWSEPPIVDKKSGRRANAGQDIQCRCYPEPIVPEIT